MIQLLLIGILSVTLLTCSACVSSSSGSTPTPVHLSTPGASLDELEEMRRVAFAYWEAFNNYDPDKTLSYLEDNYREQREDTVRDEISRVKRFRVHLGMSEEAAPKFTSPEEGEMLFKMKEPLGSRKIRMAFRKVNGEWKIVFAEEVK